MNQVLKAKREKKLDLKKKTKKKTQINLYRWTTKCRWAS